MADHQQQPPPINETSSPSRMRRCRSWLQLAVYAFFVLAGQSAATLLGRLYFNNGGQSKWIASLVQVAGFPLLLPFQWLTTAKITTTNRSSPMVLASIYVTIGIMVAADCMLYSVGLQYLPVTTFSLICASQLGFVALISSLLNRQKLTPYIINSLVLLTVSSVLLVLHSHTGDTNQATRKNFLVGFVCTLAACAGAALLLSLTQLAFQRIIRTESPHSVIDMAVYQCLVASAVLAAGLLVSGDWRRVRGEMEGFGLGKVAYVMNLFWTCVCWQVFTVGVVGLVFKVSSLFSNLIMSLGVPVGPVLAVVFLSDRLTGLKGVALLLAMWGSASYLYQHYLDDLEIKDEELSQLALSHQTGNINAVEL